MSKELAWGCTPWDDWPREKLLREVQRMYAALISVNSCLSILRRGDNAGFWGSHEANQSLRQNQFPDEFCAGSGWISLEEARQILEPLHAEYSSERMFRSFFRYAGDLLFDGTSHYRWAICDACGTMVGDFAGKPCPDCQHAKRPEYIMRPLEWRDLDKSLDTGCRR